LGLIDKLIRGSYKDDKKTSVFPHTRKEVFVQLFRYHKRTLLNVGLMCALFALPTVAAVLLSVLYKAYIPALIADGSIVPPVADDTMLSTVLLEMQVDRLVCLVLIPTNALIFVGLSGGVHVIRQAAWGENVSFFYDFGRGIKQNCKHYLVYALIFGLSLLFCVFVVGYYSVSQSHAAVRIISIAVAVTQFLTVSGVLVFALSYADIYTSSIAKELRNAFIFFIVGLPKNIGLLILTAVPLLLLLIPSAIAQTVSALAIALLFPSYAILIWVLRGDAVFDRYVNFGDNARIAGKGIVWDEQDPA